MAGSSLTAHWIKDLVSLLWLWLHRQYGFHPWLGNFCMLQTQPKKKKILLHPGHHLLLPGFCCTILIEFFYSYPASPESVLCSAARAMFSLGWWQLSWFSKTMNKLLFLALCLKQRYLQSLLELTFFSLCVGVRVQTWCTHRVRWILEIGFLFPR